MIGGVGSIGSSEAIGGVGRIGASGGIGERERVLY